MYLGRDFPPFEDQAARILGYDLAKLLDDGETITGVTGRLRTVSGTDLLPAQHLPVVAQFSGANVSQMVAFDDAAELLVGNIYALSISTQTSAGRLLIPWARFRIVPGFGVTAYPGGSPSAAAQSIVFTAAPLFFTLPTLVGGYVGQNMPTAYQGETLSYGFDFAPALSADDAITSAKSFLTLIGGTDAAVTADPNAYDAAVGFPPNISGNVVSRMLAWPAGSALAGNVYGFYLTAITASNQALTAWSRIAADKVG